MDKVKWVVNSKYTTEEEMIALYRDIDNEDVDENEEFDSFTEVEISVIREDNEEGKESYGWDGMDKIILFDEGDYSEEDIRWCEKVAQTICDALNEKGL